MARETIDSPAREGRVALGRYASYCFAAQFAAGRRVLDIGCGTGLGSQLLRAGGATTVLGVDRDHAAIASARGRNKEDCVAFVQGDLGRLSTASPEERFGLIVDVGTADFLWEPAVLMRECLALAADDALVVLAASHEAPGEQLRWEALLRAAFPSVVILPQYLVTAAVVYGPVDETRAEPTTGRCRLARLGPASREPDGYTAVCRVSRTGASGDGPVVTGIEGALAYEMTTGTESAAWQQVAVEAERAIENLERMNRQMEADRIRAVEDLEEQLATVEAQRREAAAETTRLADQVKRLEADLTDVEQLRGQITYMESSPAWRLAQLMQPVLPPDTRRGRIARKLWRRG